MTARLLQFPPIGPFSICVERERGEAAWLVLARHHGWIFGSLREARNEAASLAAGFGVSVRCRGKHPPTIQKRGDHKMAYDNKNRGALFRAEKEREGERDYSGTLDVNGTEFWISGWVKTSKTGQKFLALSITAKTPAAKAADAAADELF